jgi:hypothetical protein
LIDLQGGFAERIHLFKKLFVHFFARSKETNQRKGAQQLGLRLSSRNTVSRRRQKLATLKQFPPYSALQRFARLRCNGFKT